jgi:hypothetical protein
MCDHVTTSCDECPIHAVSNIAKVVADLDVDRALVDQPAQDGEWDDTAPTLEFRYTNWRGEQSTRRVWPIRIWYGATDYHSDKQWFLKAFDVDKQAERDFALRDMQPDQPADAGEPSCCARTREECARVVEYFSGSPMARKVAAAIRRTGDTGGRDE